MINPSQVLDALELTQADVTLDLQALIDRATATLGRSLLRYLGPPKETIEIKSALEYPALVLTLDETPTDTPQLTVETRTDPFAAWELVDGADYALEGRRLRHRTGWPIGSDLVRVTYETGYVAGEGPEHFQDVVLQAVVDRYNTMQSGASIGAGIKSETIGDYSYTNFTAAELAAAAAATGSNWERLVNQWRRRLI